VLPVDNAQRDSRLQQPAVQQVDANGDVIFRFSLAPHPGHTQVEGLEDYYRETLLELLRLVRLFSKGEPVIIDSFAFLNEPQKHIALVRSVLPGSPEIS
jgi:hypothetical protein